MYLANSSSTTHQYFSLPSALCYAHKFDTVSLVRPMMNKGFTLTSSFDLWGPYIAFLQINKLHASVSPLFPYTCVYVYLYVYIYRSNLEEKKS